MRYDVCEIETHFERDKLLYCAWRGREWKWQKKEMTNIKGKKRNL